MGLPSGSVIPLYGKELKNIEGHVVCFVSNTANVGGEDLHGKYYGTFAAKVLGVADDYSEITMEVMDADDVCNLTLDNDYKAIPQAPVDGCTKVPDKLVFAPASCEPQVTYVDDAFSAVQGAIDCSSGVCKGTAEIELDETAGQELCPSNTTFKKFIPKNFGEGTYGGYAFIGTVEPFGSTTLVGDQVICSDFGTGGDTNVEYSRYQCVPLEDVLDPAVIPDCCGCGSWVQKSIIPIP
jgi:hypothetical protein